MPDALTPRAAVTGWSFIEDANSGDAGYMWWTIYLAAPSFAIAGVYLSGFCFHAGRLAQDLLRVRMILRSASPMARGDRRFLVSPIAPTPFCAGIFSPQIILPDGFLAAFDAQTVDFVMRHEEEHVRRRAPALYLGFSLIDAVFWFNPFIRTLDARARLKAEIACDRGVLRNAPEQRRAYAQTLIDVLKRSAGDAPTSAPAVFSRQKKGDYRMRIKAIMTPPKRTGKYGAVSLALLLACAAPAAYAASAIGDEVRAYSVAMAEAAYGDDTNAQPIKRIPPRFPAICLEEMAPRETVSLRFDVNPKGAVRNVVVIETTNACFNKVSIEALEQWAYQPRSSWRRGVETLLTFQKGD